MSTLAERQDEFLRAILDESEGLPEGWSNRQAAGLAVYRGNYRSALLGALSESFERTRAYVGAKPFSQASINHVIAHPPSHWTIDEVGRGFDETCARFFKDSPEVAELAWLEWSMLQLATAPDCEAMTAERFGELAAGFGDEDWAGLRLAMQPRATARIVEHDLEALWKSLGSDDAARGDTRLAAGQSCLVWREGERPTFILAEPDHAASFTAMRDGAPYGELIGLLLGDGTDPGAEAIQQAAMRAGAMLGRWLSEGMVVAINPET